MDIITKDFIYLDTEFTTREDMLVSVGNKLLENGRIASVEKFIDDIMDREEQITTYMGDGIAIPHCKTDNILNSTVVVIRNKNDIDWNNKNEKANLVFLLSVGNSKGNNHLRILAKLAQNIMDEEFLNVIKLENNLDEVFKILKNIKE